jgi:hypothetical protein
MYRNKEGYDFVGYVWELKRDEIYIKFHKRFDELWNKISDKRVDIEFVLNRV